MKKKLFFLSFVALGQAIAQTPITINQADSPTNGLRIQMMRAINPSLNVGSAGENITLDFSNSFTTSIEDTAEFISTSLTQYSFNFSNSNLCLIEHPDSTINFLISDASGIEGVGMYSSMGMLPTKVIITSTNPDNQTQNPITQMEYPATYNTDFNDVGEFFTPTIYFPLGLPSGTIPGTDTAYVDSVKANVIIDRNSIIDAWGSITTPYGTFNYLRQKVSDTTDVISDLYVTTESFLGTNSFWASDFGISIPGTSFTDTSISYFYYTNALSANGVSLIAEIQTNAQGIVTLARCSRIYNPAGIIETENSLIENIYPNPVNLTLIIKALNNNNMINIYSSEGELIYNQNYSSSQISIPVEHLNSGNYFIEVFSNNSRSVNKFIKE
ncbi:MAG: T9SS type A sorting domain-containing protein [Flavobacteriia bacterium]|nr:T9SS type A sorting domain-containing protein [Flavobacteriia bacterium]